MVKWSALTFWEPRSWSQGQLPVPRPQNGVYVAGRGKLPDSGTATAHREASADPATS